MTQGVDCVRSQVWEPPCACKWCEREALLNCEDGARSRCAVHAGFQPISEDIRGKVSIASLMWNRTNCDASIQVAEMVWRHLVWGASPRAGQRGCMDKEVSHALVELSA